MNLSKLLKGFIQPKSQSQERTPPPAPQDYNLSENYYPKEAFAPSKQTNSPPAFQQAPPIAPEPTFQGQTQNTGGGGLDIQSILPLLASMNGGGGVNIANLLGGNKSDSQSSNPLSLVSSILGNKKDEKNSVDLNKNSQNEIENFKKISDLND